MLMVGSHADQAESAAAAERSCTVVLERLRASLDAQAAALRAELERLAGTGADAAAAGAGDEQPAENDRRAAHLAQLLAAPLRLSASAVVVSAKTLQNVDALREQLVDTAHGGVALPEFGNEQPWVYGVIVKQLTEIGSDGIRWRNNVLADEAGTPSLSWAQLQERLQSMRQPPAGAAVEVRLLGTSLEGEGQLLDTACSCSSCGWAAWPCSPHRPGTASGRRGTSGWRLQRLQDCRNFRTRGETDCVTWCTTRPKWRGVRKSSGTGLRRR